VTQREHAQKMSDDALLQEAAEFDRQAQEAWRRLVEAYPDMIAINADDTYEGLMALARRKLEEMYHRPDALQLLVEVARAAGHRDILLSQYGLKRPPRG
jgi:hypothetical protein